MTKEIHQQQSQPIHSAIVGLILLLSWLLASHLFVTTEFSADKTDNWIQPIYIMFFTKLIYWKLFILIAFIFGIRGYIFSETESTERLFYIRSLIWIIIAALLSFINLLSLSIIPLIAFGAMIFQIRKISLRAQFAGIGILLFLIIIEACYQGIPNFQALCFSGFLSNNIALSFSQMLMAQIMDTSNQVAWLFGFIVMIMGYAVGKAKWLLEYHFHYSGLRRLFFISIGLITIWGALNYINFYHFLINYKIGLVFYMLDTLTIQLLTVYVYLFILIYLENFRIGILFLRLLVQTGKLWVFNVILLFCLMFIGNSFHLAFSYGFSFFLGLTGFLTTSLLSYFIVPRLPHKADFFY